MTPIEQQAADFALEQFEREWTSEVCAVCGDAKWSCFPFCRGCSIRLQRVHLMAHFNISKGRSLEALQRWASGVGHSKEFIGGLARHYDVCRDYLINTRRSAAIGHRPSAEEHGEANA